VHQTIVKQYFKENKNLALPQSLQDLTKLEYRGLLAVGKPCHFVARTGLFAGYLWLNSAKRLPGFLKELPRQRPGGCQRGRQLTTPTSAPNGQG
jgi:hypothetical protein